MIKKPEMKTFAEKLKPVLLEIEDCLWEHEANDGSKPNFDKESFRAACKIFMAVFLDFLYTRQEAEGMDIKLRCDEAVFYGDDFRKMILRATGVDMTKAYKETVN